MTYLSKRYARYDCSQPSNPFRNCSPSFSEGLPQLACVAVSIVSVLYGESGDNSQPRDRSSINHITPKTY